MKIETAYFLTVILLLFAGCDGAGVGSEGDFQIESFKPEGFKAEGAATGVFKTTGAIVDEGTVEGDPLPEGAAVGTRVVRYRIFNSEKGYIAVRVEAYFVSHETRTVEGSYSVLQTTGVYTQAQEEGEYHVLLDRKGDPVEYYSGAIF